MGINMLDFMPQRQPFLMIDRILELSRERICTVRKVTEGDCLTASASYMLENMAQSASALFGYRNSKSAETYLAGIETAKVPWLPEPGDAIVTEVEVELAIGNLAKVRCTSQIRRQGNEIKGSEDEEDGKATAVMILYMS